MKSKHVDWTLGLKHDHQVWPWKWPWSWIFRVRYGTCCISAKNGPLPRNERQAYRLNSRPQIWPMELTVAMTLTFLSWPWAWIFRVKYGLCYISAKIVWLPQNKKQTYRLNTKPQMWSLYPRPTKLEGGVYWIHLVRRSVCPSVSWFPEHNSSLLWNFNFKFHVHVDGGHKQKPIDFQRCHFQNGRLAAILDFLVSGL